ncbi:MAG: glycoside hydrolase family 31 protein [Flavisolibacter sp.]
MKKCTFLWFLLINLSLFAQKQPFYKEDFSSGKLPPGWRIPKVGTWDPQWIVTNQPYPGSFRYQQQAPPIASASRGYHLQFQAGYFTDEDVEQWIKKKQYPDGYVISAPLDCRGRSSVILRFQQSFRWWDHGASDSAGLWVGVSTDSLHWQQWDMRHDIRPGTDMLLPLSEQINISAWAANQPKVFLRFYWKGLQAWYWMVDDIELSEADKNDVGLVRLLSQSENGNHFGRDDDLKVSIRNYGSASISKPIRILVNLDGHPLASKTLDANVHPLKTGEEREVVFSHVDLSRAPVHRLVFSTSLEGDESPSNNILSRTISTAATSLGRLTKWERLPNGLSLHSGVTQLKVLFYNNDIFRIWLSPDGHFTDPAGSDIVINRKVYHPDLKVTEDKGHIYISSPACRLQVQKAPILFTLLDARGRTLWTESAPLVFGEKTVQHLVYDSTEYFYGGGMQNGYFSHKDSMILIEKGGGWNNGGRPNPVPFYMSSRGYGALRNTFDAGSYDFTRSMALSQNENRFDCFYFVGSDLKDILGDYTALTGRPFLPARWQLGLGDANCYNKKGSTPDVIRMVADAYIRYDMPRGWILPNDGYGCGYTQLDSTVRELHKRGFYTGLWTENGVDKIATEVGQYGTRLCKLDVAWVGPGYKYALDGCRAAYKGIENNCDGRGFVWSVMGWAGTQRYSVVWTGDQKGDWEYIRFHIPTIIGSGLSAQNCATGDVDGIFGGSAKNYVRDLQWKCFTPVFMTMSGWAKTDKQPWKYGEPYTSINRKYLRLKMRLTPYMYTLMHVAHETGIPAVRALLLEYPRDTVTLGRATAYEYLLGPSFLVAPVYKDVEERDSIYLPEGQWVDYWDGRIYEGKQWLHHYPAPLDKLPLFVRAGSIIPLYPQMNYDGEKRLDTVTLDIYSSGIRSSYQLYEDDGLTRAYQKGKFALTSIRLVETKGITVLTIDPVQGHYKGMLPRRHYCLLLHTRKNPKSVLVNGKKVHTYHFDREDKNGLLTVNTGDMPVTRQTSVTIQ